MQHGCTGPVAVLDNGTGLVKAGFAGDHLPRLTFPCAIGKPSKRPTAAPSCQGVVLGWEALETPGLEVTYPMSCGIVKDFADMMMVWDATWSQLGVNPQETRLLMTDPALNPTANKQKQIEVMLEHYGFAGLSMQVQAVLTLYAHGLTTGVVLDSGDGVSHAVSVVDGYALPHLTQRLELAGRHVTEHLMELMIRRGACLHRHHDLDSVRRIKEACCYVSFDPARDHKMARETTCLNQSYTLPDGRVIKLGPERFQAPELLFKPGLVDKEQPGIARMIFNAIHEADIDNRRALYEKIVISGGNTMLPGLSSRLELELTSLYTDIVLQGDSSRVKQLKLRVHDSTDRQFMVFRGAGIMAQLLQQDRPEHWLTLAEWQEDPYRAMVRMGIVAAS